MLNDKKNKMYGGVITWNPFKGCKFDCEYCEVSFRRQAKRQKQNCIKCYNYEPHFHPERLKQYLPKDKLIFACGNGDIAFAKPEWIKAVLDEMEQRPDHTFLLQTKQPNCLFGFKIPDNCIVGTTIETNRDTSLISKAPKPIWRQYTLNQIDHSRKFVTMEPLYEFHLQSMVSWVKQLKPEFVYIGYANNYETDLMKEPTPDETQELIAELEKITEVRLKTIKEA